MVIGIIFSHYCLFVHYYAMTTQWNGFTHRRIWVHIPVRTDSDRHCLIFFLMKLKTLWAFARTISFWKSFFLVQDMFMQNKRVVGLNTTFRWERVAEKSRLQSVHEYWNLIFETFIGIEIELIFIHVFLCLFEINYSCKYLHF